MMARSRRQTDPDPRTDAVAFEVALEGTQDAVRDALGGFLAKLSPLHLTCEDIANVELVVAETLNNIVEHAFAGHPQPGFIRISCCHRQNALCLIITDLGNTMSGLAVPAAKHFDPETPVTDLPEGGFGWGLIRQLTDEITYKRSGLLNVLSLRIPLQSQ